MRAVTFFIFVSVLILSDAAHQDGFGWSGANYKSSLLSKNVKSSPVAENASGASSQTANTNSNESKTMRSGRRSLGISAWGIIAIIVALITLSTVAYYAFVLYPYLCKQQRSYDMMELSDIV